MKHIIGITMGDPAGIGPEIIIKALENSKVYSKCNPFVIGDRLVMEEAVKIVNSESSINIFEDFSDAVFKRGVIDVLNMKNFKLKEVPYGQVNEDCGRVSGEYIEKAIELAMDKKIGAMVTAPINKEAFDLGGYGKKYRGHTEMLASLTGSDEAVMLLISGNLRVIHVTTHVPMREAVDLIKEGRVYTTIVRANEACLKLGIKHPKIGVAGLNAHSGDNGLVGMEEIEEIIPAIEKARAEGMTIEGPLPGDTIFPLGKGGTYDIIVAMYHDQGHIPVKLMGFLWDGKGWTSIRGVNITMGLPIIRTSVDHGTAFGKAGKGIADEGSLLEAIDYAVLLADERGF